MAAAGSSVPDMQYMWDRSVSCTWSGRTYHLDEYRRDGWERPCNWNKIRPAVEESLPYNNLSRPRVKGMQKAKGKHMLSQVTNARKILYILGEMFGLYLGGDRDRSGSARFRDGQVSRLPKDPWWAPRTTSGRASSIICQSHQSLHAVLFYSSSFFINLIKKSLQYSN